MYSFTRTTQQWEKEWNSLTYIQVEERERVHYSHQQNATRHLEHKPQHTVYISRSHSILFGWTGKPTDIIDHTHKRLPFCIFLFSSSPFHKQIPRRHRFFLNMHFSHVLCAFFLFLEMVQRLGLCGRLDGVVATDQEVRWLAEGFAPAWQIQVRLVATALVAVCILGGGGGVSGVDIKSKFLHLLNRETAGHREAKFQPFRELFRLFNTVRRHANHIDAGGVESIYTLVYFG